MPFAETRLYLLESGLVSGKKACRSQGYIGSDVRLQVTVSPEGALRLQAVCRTTMSLSLAEDVASLELVERGGGSLLLRDRKGKTEKNHHQPLCLRSQCRKGKVRTWENRKNKKHTALKKKHRHAIEIYFTDALLRRKAGSRAEEMRTRPHHLAGPGAKELARDLGLAGATA